MAKEKIDLKDKVITYNKKEGVVTGILKRENHTSYEVTNSKDVSWHFEFELKKRK